MIYRSAEESVSDPNDREDIRLRFERFLSKTGSDKSAPA
jgi:hypothetical protein